MRHPVVRLLASVGLGLALVVSAPAAGTAAATTRSALDRPQASHLSPDLFAELSTGIALVRTFSCAGKATDEGSGFLVGTAVVMTARHVLLGACRVKVLVDGGWIGVSAWSFWHARGHSPAAADVATIKLNKKTSGHVFAIRTWSPAVGANLAALGHPLGNQISLNQGSVVRKGNLSGIPMLAVRMLAAEGGSGSPLVDNLGNVVGILQVGLGSEDILGQRTSGVILGIDLPSWWPHARAELCRAYKYGGILGCPSSTPPPGNGGGTTTTTTPPPTRCSPPTKNADCHGLYLDFQNLAGADLSGADFHGAYLEFTDLSGAKLVGAHFEHAIMTRANLNSADLGSSVWSQAFLEQVDLRGADLTNASFVDADLERADLTNAHFAGTDFTDADLRGAIGVDVAALQAGSKLCRTTLPDGTTTGC